MDQRSNCSSAVARQSVLRSFFLSLLLVVASVLNPVCGNVLAATATPVTACGQEVINGILTADLDCSSYAGPYPVLLRGKLNLNGYTLTGGSYGIVVNCWRPPDIDTHCKVLGPGTIVGGGSGVSARFGKVTDVTVTGSAGFAVIWARRLRNSTLTGNNGGGIWQARSITNTTISNNGGQGVAVVRRIKGAIITDNGSYGVSTANSIRDSTISGNGSHGVIRTSRIKNSTIADNRGAGVKLCYNFRIKDMVITGNDETGILGARGLHLIESTITGNCVTPELGVACADITTYANLPRILRNSTCDTSLDTSTDPPTSWGVCSLD